MTRSRQLGTLAAACAAQFMLVLDMTIVNVALPSIQAALGVTAGNLQWVINAYVLVIAALILVAGTLGDRFGRRRLLLAGLVIFTAASSACALSSDDPQLIAFRAVQGLGAALLAPLALAILADAFPPERRSSAIGIWAAVGGIGFGAGPIVGGVLIAAFDWSAIFWVNVPMGLAGIALTLAFVRESRDPAARPLDLPGAALSAAGLFCLTFGLIQTERHAWDSAPTLTYLGAAAVLLMAFVAREAAAREPMLPLAYFRRPRFAVANLAFACLYGGLAITLFYVSLFFQNVRDWSALRTGVSWIALNVPFLAASLLAGRLQRRYGRGRVVVAGTALAGVGTAGFGLLTAGSGFAVALPFYVLDGLGFGLAAPAISVMAVAAVGSERAGLASGVLNTSRQVGAVVGLAAFGSLGATIARSRWEDHAATLPAGVRGRAAELAPVVAGGQGDAAVGRLAPDQGDAVAAAFASGMRAAVVAAGALILLSAVLAALPPRGAAVARDAQAVGGGSAVS